MVSVSKDEESGFLRMRETGVVVARDRGVALSAFQFSAVTSTARDSLKSKFRPNDWHSAISHRGALAGTFRIKFKHENHNTCGVGAEF